MTDRLDNIKRREASATPGPWYRCSPTKRGGFTFGESEIIADLVNVTVVGWNGFDSAGGTKAQKRCNARFIAHSRQDIPYLLRRLEAAEALLRLKVVNPFAETPGVVEAVMAWEKAKEEA